MATTPFLTAGRACFTIAAAFTSAGCYAADWNETHVKNPKWPPHARFHNGQTMSMGLCLGLLTAYFAWRPVFSPGGHGVVDAQHCVTIAAVIGSLYWVTGLSAILYPGTKWTDPEFGDGAPQLPIFCGLLALTWLGWFLEMRRLGRAKA